MGIFDRFPYSSTHEMNLDFMLGKATEIAEDMQTVATGMAQVQAGLSAISEKTEQATQAAAQAAASASSIEGSVTAAEEAAEEAQMHNESAQTWANNAMTYKADCQRSATEAAASSSSAAQAATAAAASEDTVAQYAQAANASAQSAANNNDSAHQYANQASASASNATFHSTNAQTAATNAQAAATNANTSATNASASADRAAFLKTDVETLHRMCVAAVDQAATEAVNAANSAAQAAATKTDVENLVESLPEDFTDLNNTVNQLSDEIVQITDNLEVEHGKLFPAPGWVSGKYVKKDNNTITAGGQDLSISDYIEIPVGCQKIVTNPGYASLAWQIAFYDDTKTFVSGVAGPTNPKNSPTVVESADIPANARYLIVTTYTLDMLPASDVYIEFSVFPRIAGIETEVNETVETLAFDNSFENVLKGASTFTDNKFVDNTGSVTSNPNFVLIDGYYPVKPNTLYKLYRGEPALYSNSGHNYTFYDANKAFLSYTLSGSGATSPANAAYMRLGIYISSTGSATHENFDPTNVIVTESAKPCIDSTFVQTPARPTLNGLKWIGVGDSITEDNFRATYHYWSYIQAETGLNFVNMGVSGTGYKAEGSGDKAFYKRVPSMATDADIITILGGVNDIVLSNATIGTASDTGTETICGCVNTTIDAIETLYPAHMPLGIISPLPTYCSDTTVNVNPYQRPDDDTCRMAVFVEQLALICKHRGIPFLDLFHQSNLRPWHAECNAKYFSCNDAPNGDGLHPNGHGHRTIYRQIMQFVEKLAMR